MDEDLRDLLEKHSLLRFEAELLGIGLRSVNDLDLVLDKDLEQVGMRLIQLRSFAQVRQDARTMMSTKVLIKVLLRLSKAIRKDTAKFV